MPDVYLRGNDALVQMVIGEHESRPVGSRALINHLTSENGQSYNLKECVVVGRDPITPSDILDKRLHVRLIEPGTNQPTGAAVRMRRQNLVPLMPDNNPNPTALHGPMPRPPWRSQTQMKDDKTLQLLKVAYKHAVAAGNAKPPDRGEPVVHYQHMMFLKRHLDQGKVPPVSKCMEGMIPESEITDEIKGHAEIKPPCFGVGEVDFRRFRECCSEGAQGDEDVVNCMQEWVLSGFCEQCQISIFGRKNQQHFMSGGPGYTMDSEGRAWFAA